MLFENGFSLPPNRQAVIQKFTTEITKACEKLDEKEMSSRTINIRWRFPSQGWVNLNTNGASKGNPEGGGGGGLIWDETGAWIAGFSFHIGYCMTFTAELWGIYRGLLMGWNRGFKRSEWKVTPVLSRDCNE